MLINRHAMRRFREFAGLSLSQLQVATADPADPDDRGVSLSYLSEIESGRKTNVNPARVKQIADALNVPVAALASVCDDSVEAS